MATRVFVLAPTPVTRTGLRSMLASAEGTEVQVVGEASSPTDLSALSVAEDSTQAVVLVSDEEHVVPRLRAMQLKGWGVVPPDAPSDELAAAVAAAGQGLTVLPKTLTERLLQEPAVSIEELSETLTAREREVLDLLGHGLSNKLIARELHISEHTVKFHISSLYAKLGVSNRAEASLYALENGIVPARPARQVS